MNTVEFGKENSQVILLLHGGGLSWWNYREVASLLSVRYHVVIPLLDGHAGSCCAFTSIEDAAEKLKKFIEVNYGGKVLAVGGLSLGGQILTQLLSIAPDICQYAVIESALVIPMKLTHLLVDPLVSMSYGLIQKRWFSKIQFQQLHILPGFQHGDLSINHPEEYVKLLRSVMEK